MAADAETVAWVKPPEPIQGLDHLGVQSPCIALYGQLLPGITNVTDRARNYSESEKVTELGKILDEIAEADVKARRPLLAAVVVRADTRVPSAGLFKFAK